jgi:sterol desaturase/sphingolipid hydroxylase (fatty acid hydroxylase superfamily)
MNELTMFAIAIPAFILTMIVEWWWIHHLKKDNQMIGYTGKDTAASLGLGIGYLGLSALWKVVQLPIYALIYNCRFFEIEPTLWSWIAIVVLVDFCFYWYHRLNHEIRFLWAGHVNHHSSQHYNLSTALRQSWTSYMTAFVFYIPILLLGFDPIMLVIASLLHLFYQYWIHTEAIDRLGWLEHILMTPSHHRVHHAVNPQYIDRNHGGMLIIWDMIFGTFEPEVEAPIYGITENIESYNLLTIAFHEYKAIWRDILSAKSIGDVLGYFFKAPGWKPSKDEQPKNPNSITDPSLLID